MRKKTPFVPYAPPPSEGSLSLATGPVPIYLADFGFIHVAQTFSIFYYFSLAEGKMATLRVIEP